MGPARVAGLSAGPTPAGPSRLRAALTDSGDIRLDWRDNSDDETGFRIASSDESDPILVEANRVVHRAQLPAGGSTCFRVQPFNDFGGSSWSREACAGASQAGFAPPAVAPMMLPPIAGAPILPPNPPRGLRARPINHNTIQLDWTDTSDNEMGFYIDGTGGFFTLGRNTTTTRVGGLLPMTSYCFRVFAVSDGGQSGTNEACATTPPPPPF